MKKFIILFVSLFIWAQGVHAEFGCAEAETFMSDIGKKVIDLLTDKLISDQERADQFREILETKFNVKAIGKFVLGRYWKQASAEEKDRFLNLFKETTVASYATRFKEYTSERFDILGSRPEPDGGITVFSQIVRPNAPTITIDWKIFQKNNEIRIYDVILAGISMGITQRSEYASVIQKDGGGIEAISMALERKLTTRK